LVDRRFNRRRYDAAQMIQAFSTRLRDEVDLDTLTAELLALVDQVMQATRMLLWLRPSAGASRDQTTTSASLVRPGSSFPNARLSGPAAAVGRRAGTRYNHPA
jgi:hypothetical protein